MKTIVITGSHSVGKSTLAERLFSKISPESRVTLIPEMARLLIARGIPMNDKVSEFAIANYILEYFRHRRRATGDFVISDRSIFDLYAYVSTSRPTEVRIEFVEMVEEIVFNEAKTVDFYVYVPIEFGLHVDEVRPADAEYQQLIDRRVQSLLAHFGCKAITARGTLEQRVATVIAALNA